MGVISPKVRLISLHSIAPTTSTDPLTVLTAMPPPATFRFEITYTAYTARDLVSGFLSRQQYNEMFMADLTAIGVDRPQYHALEKTGSAISFLYKPTSRTQVH